jgi:hypothetical protein
MKNYCIWLALKAGDHEHTEAYENLQLIRFFFKNSTKMYASPHKMYRSAVSVEVEHFCAGLYFGCWPAVAGVKGCVGLDYLNTERVTRLLNKLHKVSLMVCILQKFCREIVQLLACI